MARTTGRTTTDHDEIRRWAEERNARPCVLRGTEILRLDFPGYTGEDSLDPIAWDEWFRIFDDRELGLIYEEETASGEKSNFNKLVSRETLEASTEKRTRRSRAKKSPSSRTATASGRRASMRKASRTTARSSRSGKSRGAAKKSSSRSRAAKSTAIRKASSASGTRRAAAKKKSSRSSHRRAA